MYLFKIQDAFSIIPLNIAIRACGVTNVRHQPQTDKDGKQIKSIIVYTTTRTTKTLPYFNAITCFFYI